RIETRAFSGRIVEVGALFDTQWKRHPDWYRSDLPEPIPDWLLPAEKRLGLEYLLLLGHPERRREVWNNRAPCTLAFGSPAEAARRFRDFVDDACRWVSQPIAAMSGAEPGSD